jgi:hypothetical protein
MLETVVTLRLMIGIAEMVSCEDKTFFSLLPAWGSMPPAP